MPSFPVIKAAGLQTSPNQLAAPQGSLVQASNVIIRRDNVIEPRRGFKLFGQSFGTLTDTLKQMFVYRERLLRHYNNILEFQNGTNNDGSINFDEFSGNFTETQTGLRIKSLETNGNLYFTTDQGIKKISAKTGSQLSTADGFITRAGGVKALDMEARIDYQTGNQTGFLPQDSTVAYRHLWNITDANNNLIQGTPSQRVEVFNELQTLLIRDFNNLLLALDRINQSGSLITDGNYVSTLGLTISDSASDLKTNAIALAAKLDSDIAITEGAINTASATVSSTTVLTLVFNADVSTYIEIGDQLLLSGFTAGGLTQLNARSFNVTNVATTTVTATVVGAALANQASTPDVGGIVKRNKYTLITQPGTIDTPPTDAELVDLQNYISEIIIELQSEPTGIISTSLQDDFVINLDVTTSANVILNLTIPTAVTINHFLQVYRSAITQATGTDILSELTPDDEMQLVYEKFLTQDQIDSGEYTFTDITPDAFRGSNLYTNEQSGEGITQANDIPPFAKDINKFKNVTFYANTRTKQRKLLSLIGVSNMLVDYGSGLNTKTFTSGDVDTSSDFLMITAHGYSEGQSVRFTNPTPSNLPSPLKQGTTYYILNADTNSFQLSIDIDSTIPVNLTTGGTGTHTIQNILPKFLVSSNSQEYSFIKGITERTTVQTVADVAGSLDGKRWLLNSANDETEYYVYYQENSASSSDPMVSGRIGIPVYYTTGASANTIALLTCNTINALFPEDFLCTVSTDTVTVNNVNFGYTTDATAGDTGFTVTVTIQGQGEDASLKRILLSDNVSPAIAVDETARSLVRVINKNSSENIYAYYLSTSETIPGKMFLEEKYLNEDPFYLLANSETTGSSFNPNLSPSAKIVSISDITPYPVLTDRAHGLTTGDTVIINDTNSTPVINGVQTVTVIDSTSFTVGIPISIAGTYGAMIPTNIAEVSENETKPNRIYYSKPDQPEAVPLTNYFDVGAEEQQILRIFPLRDSLFTFKQDGLYRVSGESAPFNRALFDGSCNLQAPDSLGLESNLIYGWVNEGIVTVSESGVSKPVSRPIDNILLKLQTYENFNTATFGIGYSSDNSYLVWTVNKIDDVFATTCYRFSSLTGTWTTFDKTNTCGILNNNDNKLYLGAGDRNYTEQERKDFTRLDYADRDFALILNDGNYFNTKLKFESVSDISIGDVLTQDQTVTTYIYNMLLKKLDIDPSVGDTDYFSTLEASSGDSMRTNLIALAQKLDTDPGVADTDYESTIESKAGSIDIITASNPTVLTSTAHGLFTGRMILISGSNCDPSIDGTYEVTVIDDDNFSINFSVLTAGDSADWSTLDNNFQDLLACYNKVIDKLNQDTGVSFGNYQAIENTTLIEAIVTDINKLTKTVTVNLDLQFIVGTMTCFKKYDKIITYSPLHAGDPLGFKQFSEATMMFDNKAFTEAILAFGSDLLPAFNEVDFLGDGNGVFGNTNFGAGFFGGGSNSAPFRTYIPLNVQRCRYLTVRFQHSIARETFAINGLTGSYNTYSIKAYK